MRAPNGNMVEKSKLGKLLSFDLFVIKFAS